MSDDQAPVRPQPRFGAYATPEEQRARMGLPPEQPVPPIDPALVPQDTPVSPEPDARRMPLTGGRLLDRVVTIALLAYGLFNTISAIPLFTDPAAVLDLMGIEAELADYGAQRTAGVIAVVVMVIGWLATTWLVWRRGASGRSTWWIALLAGVVFNVVASIILAVALVQDPNVLDAVLQMQRPS